MKTFKTVFAVLTLSLSSAVIAAEFSVGPITLVSPKSAPTVPGLKTGGVFFESVSTTGARPDKLIAASSPVAATVELHRMKMDGDIMRMRQVEAIEISPDKPVSFERGKADAYHLMLMNLKQPLKLNESFPVTMEFEQAGTVEVTVQVQPHGGGQSHHQHQKHKHH
ncbi:MAG: copper chaperone PCu(A)C [Burkholderiaceae bacterium]